LIEFILGVFIYVKIKKKYKLLPCLKHWTMWLPLSFACFYIFLEITTWMRIDYFISYAYYIKTATLLSYVPLILKYQLYQNDREELFPSPMLWAGFCLWFGSVLNKLALKANSNYMPVYPDLSYWTGYIKPGFVQEGIHILGDAYSNLIPLCDIFDSGWKIYSLGDLICGLFIVVILYCSIKRLNEVKYQ